MLATWPNIHAAQRCQAALLSISLNKNVLAGRFMNYTTAYASSMVPSSNAVCPHASLHAYLYSNRHLSGAAPSEAACSGQTPTPGWSGDTTLDRYKSHLHSSQSVSKVLRCMPCTSVRQLSPCMCCSCSSKQHQLSSNDQHARLK